MRLCRSATFRGRHLNGVKVDHKKAQGQHDELAAALRDAGVELCYIEEPDPTRHWAVYSRDFAVNSPEGIVICRFKYAERKGEEIPGEKQLKKLGYKIIGRIERGAWEGGDNRYVDEKHLATGQGERSTWPGIYNAQEILEAGHQGARNLYPYQVDTSGRRMRPCRQRAGPDHQERGASVVHRLPGGAGL